MTAMNTLPLKSKTSIIQALPCCYDEGSFIGTETMHQEDDAPYFKKANPIIKSLQRASAGKPQTKISKAQSTPGV